MANHITNVMEFREAGLFLKAGGTHVIRVLGALKEIPLARTFQSKEEMTPLADRSVYERYYAGELAGSQEDPSLQPFYPQVPAFFITHDGQPVFLERDLA